MQPSQIGTCKVLLCVGAFVLLTIGAADAGRQDAGPVTAQSGASAATAIDITSGDVQAATKRGQEALEQRGDLNDRLITVADMGQYNIGIAMVVRKATATATGAFSHLKVTEVYYILRGSGVQVTGTLVDGKGGGPDPLIGPT